MKKSFSLKLRILFVFILIMGLTALSGCDSDSPIGKFLDKWIFGSYHEEGFDRIVDYSEDMMPVIKSISNEVSGNDEVELSNAVMKGYASTIKDINEKHFGGQMMDTFPSEAAIGTWTITKTDESGEEYEIDSKKLSAAVWGLKASSEDLAEALEHCASDSSPEMSDAVSEHLFSCVEEAEEYRVELNNLLRKR